MSMLLRRSWRYVLAAVVVLVVALVVYGAWSAYKVDKSLSAVEVDASALKAAALNGDEPGVQASLDKLSRDAGTAHDHTSSWVWSLGTHLPVYGKDLRGIRVASDVADNLSHGGLADLVESMTKLDALVPRNGHFDVAAIKTLQGPVARGDAALDQARTQLAAEDPSGYVERLKEKFRAVQSQIDSAAAAMDSAKVAAQVLPTMLGAQGAQHYLVIFQNNAEVRATGGLPGQVSYVTARNGKLRLVDQVAGNDPRLNRTALPITKLERKIWQPIFGQYFLDANFTPDFPRTAQLWQAHWQQAFGQHIDGVIALDPVTISYLLKATGPITVDGVQLSSSNAVDFLLHQVYLDRPDPAQQDLFFHDVAQATFTQFASTNASPKDLIGALLRGTDERRLFVHSFVPSVQKHLDGTLVDGAVETKPASRPQVTVAVNDLTGAKMSYYLRYNVAVTPTYCTNGVQGLSGQATFTSKAPTDAAKSLPAYVTGGGAYGVDPGNQYDQMTLYGPIGGTVTNVLINGKSDPVDVWRYRDGNRQVAQIGMLLKPAGQENVSWTMTGGKGQTGGTDVDVTPSVIAGSSSSVVASACS